MNVTGSAPSTFERPYAARELTLPELRAGDIHSFESPKEQGRLVRVVGIPRIAQALLLEFDPTIVAYVERPRILQVDRRHYELCFWCREQSGRERMLLVVTHGQQEPGPGPKRRAHREAAALIEAASNAHLPLEFVAEADLLAQGPRVALAYSLLPGVQTALRLANRALLQAAIVDTLTLFPRMRFAQLLTALDGYASADVLCVLAYLLHAGAVTCDATERLLRSTTFEVRP